MKNDSLELPAGQEGIVIGAKHFSRRTHLNDEQKKDLEQQMKALQVDADEQCIKLFRQMVSEVETKLCDQVLIDPNTRQKVGRSENPAVILEQVDTFDMKWVKPASARPEAERIFQRFWPRIEEIRKECRRRLEHMKRGDELPSGVLEMVKVYVATKRTLGGRRQDGRAAR